MLNVAIKPIMLNLIMLCWYAECFVCWVSFWWVSYLLSVINKPIILCRYSESHYALLICRVLCMLTVANKSIMLSIILMSVIYAECNNKAHYAGCHYSLSIYRVLSMQSVANKHIILSVILMTVIYGECGNKAHNAECLYAECYICWVSWINPSFWVSYMQSFANKPVILCVVMLNVVMLNVVMLNLVMLCWYAECYVCWVSRIRPYDECQTNPLCWVLLC
jgi:hypothetical protein